MIRKITAAGVVTTLAGTGTNGYLDGPGTTAEFSVPSGVAVDAAGNVYVADAGNQRIRMITSAGVVTTIAGGAQGYQNGIGTAALFCQPSGVVLDTTGDLDVADQCNNRIREITPAGLVTTIAGSGVQGFQDGTGAAAQFGFPSGVALDGNANLYVADQAYSRIRLITSAGVVTTMAGGSSQGSQDGPGATATFSAPLGVAVTASGTVYVADTGNHRIRMITTTAPASPQALKRH
jgi:sugar lactone lactonase YvrE